MIHPKLADECMDSFSKKARHNYDFGIIISTMHMSWVRITGGRLKSDYSYSTQFTYNNSPWPENPTEKQNKAIKLAAQNVLHS
ncbi:MAG: hypothetical protein Q8R57_09440 [Bacteroidota bacterium]|nr:hypothetical protein [Bacteroidota bacterium]